METILGGINNYIKRIREKNKIKEKGFFTILRNEDKMLKLVLAFKDYSTMKTVCIAKIITLNNFTPPLSEKETEGMMNEMMWYLEEKFFEVINERNADFNNIILGKLDDLSSNYTIMDIKD